MPLIPSLFFGLPPTHLVGRVVDEFGHVEFVEGDLGVGEVRFTGSPGVHCSGIPALRRPDFGSLRAKVSKAIFSGTGVSDCVIGRRRSRSTFPTRAWI